MEEGEAEVKGGSMSIFDKAWSIVKKDDGWFDDSRFPLSDDVCENCEKPKNNFS